jgi:RHS repeat-associated protein
MSRQGTGMGSVQALDMDVVTENSGHSVVGMAVSVCLTPAAPAPLPIPYPLTASVAEGISDSPLRTKVCGVNCATIGSVLKTCHGNEPGTLKEVVSLNQMGPVAPVTGAFTVLIELGPAAFTGSLCDMNKAPTPGAGSNASDAGGTGGSGGAGGGAPGAGGSPGSPDGPAGGGSGSGSSADGAAGTSSAAAEEHTCQDGHPVDVVSGAVVDKATDLKIPGLIPLVFERYYSSYRHDEKESSLGPGWAHSFDQRVVPRDKVIALRDGQGRFIRFEKVGVGQSSFHRRERLTLTRSDELEFRVYSHEVRRTSVFAPIRPDGPAVLRRIEDNYGNAIAFEYRAERLARVVDTAGRKVNVAWRGALIASLSVASGGLVVSYEYGRNGCLAAVRNPLGHVEKFRYDRLDRMVSTTTLSGAEFVYEYDGASPRCVSSYGPEGLFEVHLTRDAERRVTVVDAEEPRVIEWNDLGLAERALQPDGTLLNEAAYDADGLLIARANGAGEGYQYWYDDKGRRIRMTDPCMQATTYEYLGDNLVGLVDSQGHVTRISHDAQGSITAIAYPTGENQFRRYDELGRLTEVTGTRGRIVTYEYDRENNVIAETDARTARSTYRYDGLGRPTAMRDALGRETRATYDAAGNRLSLVDADGAATSFAYDSGGHLARITDALGRATKFEYSGLHFLSRVTAPDGRTWRIEPTRAERIKNIINPLGEVYSFDRDLAGRVIGEKTFDGRELRYELDGADRTTRVKYSDGGVRELAYDRGGRLTRDETADERQTFELDALGRVMVAVMEGWGERHETRFVRDTFGRILAESQGDRCTRFEYDTLGRRTRRTLPNGSTTNYSFDAADALIRVEHDGFQLDLECDVLGREVAAHSSQSGISIARSYDRVDRWLEQRATGSVAGESAPRVLAEQRWTYDRVGRVERVDDVRWGPTAYAYDSADQLVEARRGPLREAFGYDASRSVVAAFEELEGAKREAHAELAPGNVLLKFGDVKYSYDGRGRRIQRADLEAPNTPKVTEYVWDGRDRLREATLHDGTRIVLTYDAFGRRVRKETVPTRGTPRAVDYVWDGPVLAMDIDRAAGARVFVHRLGSFVPLLQQERGEVFLYVADRLGTPRELLTPDGLVAWSAAYGAWGNVVAEYADPSARARYGGAVSSPFRLLGQIADDELGLCFTRYRLFDPAVGRWLSPDPIGLRGGLNLYAFGGPPSLYVDPWGLTTKKPHPKPAGIVYRRTDPDTGEKYIGQAKSEDRFAERQKEENRDLGKEHDFEEIGRAQPGTALSKLEEDKIRQEGGVSDVDQGGTLANKRHQMSDDNYKAAGGTVPRKPPA